MEAAPPGDSLASFWPAPVARLIADQQTRFAAGLTASETSSARTPTVTAGPAAADSMPPSAGPTSPPPSPTETIPPGRGGASPGATQPLPGMGRRRALAALAGAVTAGLVVAGWELTRPRPAAAGNLTSAQPAVTKNPAAQRRITSLPAGREVWNYETNGEIGALMTAGGVVYAGTLQSAVYALDGVTGKPLWYHRMSKGQTNYLATTSDAVIAANGWNGTEPQGYLGGLYALDRGTGKLLWSAYAPGVIVLAVAGDVVYAGTAIKDDLTFGVTALVARTGELLWTVNFPTEVDIGRGVAVDGGVVYATTARGEIFAFSAATGQQLWRNSDPEISYTSAPVIADGIVYSSTGHWAFENNNRNPVLCAVEAGTGRGLWQRSLGTAPSSFAAGVEAGLLFAGLIGATTSSGPGAGAVIALNASTGQQLWQVPVAGGAWSVTPGTDNVVYSGSGVGVLDAWQGTTGNHLWSYRAAGYLNGNIAVDSGVAYVGGTSRRVYAVATGA